VIAQSRDLFGVAWVTFLGGGMIPIRFGPQVCTDLGAASAREWLVADGCGGFAMGTVSGLRTRRYHGLLVVTSDAAGAVKTDAAGAVTTDAAGGPPAGLAARRLALASLDPIVTLAGGAEVRLATHEWTSGAVVPAGHELLASFDLDDGLPRWRWRIGDVVIERELATPDGNPGVGLVHRLLAGGPVRLHLDALVTWRDAHGERTAAGRPPRVEPTADGVRVEDAFCVSGPGWQASGEWWRGVHYREEAARGLTADEDLWYAGRFGATLDAPGDVVEVAAWPDASGSPIPRPVAMVSAARARRRAIADAVAARSPGASDPEVVGSLAVAADAFVVRGWSASGGSASGAGRPDVVAGYPWFGAWSRDTMLSYPGLFLATGRADEGRDLLLGYAQTLSDGMLANTADTGELRYNTVDGTLWFAYAVDRHVAATGDTDLARDVAPTLRDVISAHVAGVRYGIRMTDDGLLTQGADGEALTWMDARIDGVPVTPRIGKAVEVNALWVNALASAAVLCRAAGQPTMIEHGDRSIDVESLATSARLAFADRFLRADGTDATLPDIVDGDDAGEAEKLRPNQVLAWSLPYAPLAPQPRALSRIAAALATPLGMRTLDPADPDYRPRHRGGPADRDCAYHQGTVWPWLIGPYVDACRRAGVPVGDATFIGLVGHLADYGLGSVSETADGDPPHGATGCPFQAWSVAELLRVCASTEPM
jgi:predicted glycogen debranching enzyme